MLDRKSSTPDLIRGPAAQLGVDFAIQIFPFRVCSLDQIDLPTPAPPFYAFLVSNSLIDGRREFRVDEPPQIVAFAKVRAVIILMSSYPRGEVRCYADVHRPTVTIGHYVYPPTALVVHDSSLTQTAGPRIKSGVTSNWQVTPNSPSRLRAVPVSPQSPVPAARVAHRPRLCPTGG